jgi:hypothetical protein
VNPLYQQLKKQLGEKHLGSGVSLAILYMTFEGDVPIMKYVKKVITEV